MLRSPTHPALRGCLLAAALTLYASSSAAQEFDPLSSFRFSGFGTLGLAKAHASEPGWGFRRDATQPLNSGGARLDTDSRLGLQGNVDVNPRIELVSQVLVKPHVASSTTMDSLEWAFASYRPSSDWVVRVGRVSDDLLQMSDYRSVGFAYPWVRPNIETYGTLRIIPVDGADVARTWDNGDETWRAKTFAGRGHVRGATSANAPDYKFDMDYILGGMVSREASGVLLRATAARFRGGIGEASWKPRVRSTLAQVQALPDADIAAQARSLAAGIDPDAGIVSCVAIEASYDRSNWLLSTELARTRSRLTLGSGTYGYASVGRRFGAVTIYAMAGWAKTDGTAPALPQWTERLTALIGSGNAQAAQDAGTAAAQSVGSRVHQHSMSFGARWDLGPRIALKAQWDHFTIDAHGSLLWANGTSQAAHADVATIVLDFVF